jgi:hypothetical protein
MEPCIQTSTARPSRSRPRRVKQSSSLNGMFADTTTTTTTTPPPDQLLHALHESSESENIGIIRVLRRIKRRLLLEMAADAQSVQALEEGVRKTPETPVELTPQDSQRTSLVGHMKPADRPVQKVSSIAEPATFQLSRAQAA